MKAVAILLCAATFTLVTPTAAEDMLRIAIPQRGTWDTSISEIGQKAGIFKKHGLNLDLLFTGAGAEVIGGIIGGSIDLSIASGISTVLGAYGNGAPLRDLLGPRCRRSAGKSIGSAPAGFADQDAGRHERQDHRLFGRRLVEPRRAAGAAGAGEDQRQADGARRRHGKHHRRNERPGRCRLVGDAVRIEGLRRRQDPHYRPGRRRQSLAGPHRARQLYERQHARDEKDQIERYMAGYKEATDYMYSSPEALKMYAEIGGVPLSIAQKMQTLVPAI